MQMPEYALFSTHYTHSNCMHKEASHSSFLKDGITTIMAVIIVMAASVSVQVSDTASNILKISNKKRARNQ